MSRKVPSDFVFPPDAQIESEHFTYQVNHQYGGKYITRDLSEAQKFAGSGDGNGSGEITMIARRRFRYRSDDGRHVSMEVETRETLPPVKKFSPQGEKRRLAHEARKTCSHKNLGRWVMEGAGCQKSYVQNCVDCGKAVNFD